MRGIYQKQQYRQRFKGNVHASKKGILTPPEGLHTFCLFQHVADPHKFVEYS